MRGALKAAGEYWDASHMTADEAALLVGVTDQGVHFLGTNVDPRRVRQAAAILMDIADEIDETGEWKQGARELLDVQERGVNRE